MSGSIKLITGGADRARKLFEGERRGDWSQALPLVLEKHGYLDLEVGGIDALSTALSDPQSLIVVASLDPGAWSKDLIHAVIGSRSPILVEGPLPPLLSRALEIDAAPVSEPGFRVEPVDATLRGLSAAHWADPSGYLGESTSRPVDRDSALDWQSLASVPVDERQAAAWRAPGWDADRWRVGERATVLAELTSAPGQTRSPAIARFGRLTVCCFGLLAYLGQRHSSEPFEPGEHRSSGRTAGLEALLLGLLDQMHQQAGMTRARVLPWPAGARWAMSVRHDFDRPQGPAEVRDVLERHRAGGTAATWYWRTRHLEGRSAERGRPAIAEVRREPRHEIALHAEAMWAGQGENVRLEEEIDTRVLGTSAHGDPGCFRFQGAPNVLWAESQGYSYTELIQQAHQHPHRFPALRADGTIEPLEVLCLPHHESFDRSSAGGDVSRDSLATLGDDWEPGEGFAQILNHPDINLDELFAGLSRIPNDGRLNWTAGQVADWWRRTHVRGNLVVSRIGPRSFEATSAQGVQSLALEFLEPDGMLRYSTVDLEPNASARIDVADSLSRRSSDFRGPDLAPGGTADARQAYARERWDRKISPVVEEHLRRWFEERGIDPESAASETTIRTNAELVPKRAEALTSVLEALPGDGLLAPRILEAGAGFGALGTYIAMSTAASSLLAIDIDSKFAKFGNELARAAGVGGVVEYRRGDMTELPVETGSVDLLIANNSLLYVKPRDEMRRALGEFNRVLAPGGRVLVHQANRLRARDPFTNAPLPPAAPRPLVSAIAKLTGWEHSRDRVLLLSPVTLRRELRRAGFEDVKSIDMSNRPRNPVQRHFARFIAVAGSRPDSDDGADGRADERGDVGRR